MNATDDASGPAAEATADLEFWSRFTRPMDELIELGFLFRHLAEALCYPNAADREELERLLRAQRLNVREEEKLSALVWICWRRVSHFGHRRSSTHLWWQAKQAELGWDTPAEVFPIDPERVFNTLTAVGRVIPIQTHRPRTKPPKWVEALGIFSRDE